MKSIPSILVLGFAAALSAAPKPSPTPTPDPSSTVYVLGEVKVVGSRSDAEARALREAALKAVELLAKQKDQKKSLKASDVMSAATAESSLAAWDLGLARIESVTQQRWEAPEGKEAWSARVMISIRRR